jgi:hypothetical protein
LFVDDGVRGQLGDDIFVVAGALAEMRAQDVMPVSRTISAAS